MYAAIKKHIDTTTRGKLIIGRNIISKRGSSFLLLNAFTKSEIYDFLGNVSHAKNKKITIGITYSNIKISTIIS